MIVKDLSNSFHPYLKNGLKKEEQKAVRNTKKKRERKKERKQKRVKDRLLYYATKHKIQHKKN